MNAAAKASTALLSISSERDARGHLLLIATAKLCPACLGDRTRHEGGDYPVACKVCGSRGADFELRGSEAIEFLNDLADRDLLSYEEEGAFHPLLMKVQAEEYAARPFACRRGHRQHLTGACVVCAEQTIGRAA
jgi:hypothetical protein